VKLLSEVLMMGVIFMSVVCSSVWFVVCWCGDSMVLVEVIRFM